jgi:general secretion pathway protein A
MVLNFYQLAEQPFGVTPDPRYLFMSPTHREALASLAYDVSSGRGFTALIAKPGMGKTTLLFDLLDLVQDQARTAFLFQLQCSPRDLLHGLLEDLGIEHDGDDVAQMHRKLNECAMCEGREGKQLVVVVDEAQNLDEPALELLRMLSNFETPRQKLMHFVLAGQPQLAEKLSSPELVQLRQRISIVARLKPFTLEETQLYIDHRLRVAGYDFARPMFTKRAITMIAEYTEGIPRNINNACFNAMSLGCVNKQKTIDADVIQEVLGDLDLHPMFPEPVAVSKPELSKEAVPELPSHKKPRSPLRGWSIRFALAAALVVAAASGLLVRSRQQQANVLASAPVQAVKDSAPTPMSAPVATSQEQLEVSASVVRTSQSSEPNFVYVLPNESLYHICLHYFGNYDKQTLAKVRELNPWISDPRRLKPGEKIQLPIMGSTSHKFASKDERIPITIDAATEKP